jgi:hypothetical protein
MKITSPFHLAPDTGNLSVDHYESTFSPGLRMAEFQRFDLFSIATKVPPFPRTDEAFQVGPVKVADGTWFYVNVGFSHGVLRLVGFGWGKLRDGFYELTTSEFAEQLHSYKAWLETEIGPSLPCDRHVIYQNQLPWGSVEASSDARTKLPGIGMRFE